MYSYIDNSCLVNGSACMKSFHFIAVIVGAHIFFIFFYIYHQSIVIKLSFQQQRLEKIQAELIEQKKELQHTLEKIKSRSFIKKYAEECLHWQKVRLTDIKRFDNDQQSA